MELKDIDKEFAERRAREIAQKKEEEILLNKRIVESIETSREQIARLEASNEQGEKEDPDAHLSAHDYFIKKMRGD